jgi:hypothetical protein
MRMLTWGIIALFGLGMGLAAMRVHDSRNERAAIRRAVRAPFADLRRRDALRLCADFTPAVDARLAPGNGSCPARLTQTLDLTRSASGYVAAPEPTPPSRLSVTRISWQGDQASAVSSYPGIAGSERHWRLQRVGQRWRIATPARLDMRSGCQHRQFGGHACVNAMSIRFAHAAAG